MADALKLFEVRRAESYVFRSGQRTHADVRFVLSDHPDFERQRYKCHEVAFTDVDLADLTKITVAGKEEGLNRVMALVRKANGLAAENGGTKAPRKKAATKPRKKAGRARRAKKARKKAPTSGKPTGAHRATQAATGAAAPQTAVPERGGKDEG